MWLITRSCRSALSICPHPRANFGTQTVVCYRFLSLEYPQMWVRPQVPLEGPPPPTPPRTPPPTPDWAAPSRTPGALQKEPRGVGGRGRERAGREGLWLEGRVLQLQWGMGGGPSKHQLGPDPHLGAPNSPRANLPNLFWITLHNLVPSEKKSSMRAEIIAYMIYSEGSEYPENAMHFLPKVFRDPQISEYVAQILSQSVLLSRQKIA